jgi:thiol-disulfide isomerase/thioredoxin
MRKIIFAIFLFVIFSQTAFAGKLPDFRLKNLDNKIVSYSQLKGKKLTVIDFWATWCKPCVRAIPKLVKLHEQYKKDGVEFIGVNVDGTRNLPKVKPFAHSLNIAYPVLLDENNEVMNKLKVTAMPTIIIANADDEIVFFHQGYRPGDEKALEDEIKKLLAGGGAPDEK